MTDLKQSFESLERFPKPPRFFETPEGLFFESNGTLIKLDEVDFSDGHSRYKPFPKEGDYSV